MASDKGVDGPRVPIHLRLLEEDEPKVLADVLGDMVGRVDYRQQFTRERLLRSGE
jgi:hypothetical protein